jgi:uncharacterized membrane protein
MSVKKSRSFTKSITWRVIALITTFGSLYAITGEIETATMGTIVTNLINFVAYYYHERVWNKIGWGKDAGN